VAVRRLGATLQHQVLPDHGLLGRVQETEEELGEQEFLERGWYGGATIRLMDRIEAFDKEAKPAKVNLLDRFRTVSVTPL
jgi:hypothetical protein